MIVKTIAFDLDGTLIESASLVGEILNSMRLEKGLAPLGSDCYRVWSSRGGNYLVGHALEAGSGIGRRAARRISPPLP